ncbi:MAG: type IV secretion system protein, partial [Rickettsiales bacterium]|nr:type IV secretion system protein [Rickettsiales bacterium]
IMYTSVNSLYPLSTRIPFAIFANWNSDEYYPELRKLADQMVDSEKVIREYFLTNYVKDREEYAPPVDDVKTKANQNRESRVMAQSNKRVQRTYKQYIDIYNPDGPYQVYGYHTSREVIDESIVFTYDKQDPSVVVVNFQTEESRNNKSKKSNWKATITFSLTDIDVVLETRTELKLTVREYEVIRVQ